MYDDRAFATYALALIGIVFSLLTVTVVAGIASAPPLGFMVEHLALGLMIRTSYKSFGGADWVRDFLEYTGMVTANDGIEMGGAAATPA